jgi:hypothetical protein
MIRDSLKNLINTYFANLDEMSDDKKDEVFLEIHKELVFLLNRDFGVSDPIITMERLNLIDKTTAEKLTKTKELDPVVTIEKINIANANQGTSKTG